MGGASERLLGLASAVLLGQDPSRCSLDGDMMFSSRTQGSAFGSMEKVGVHFRKVWSTATFGRKFSLIGSELRYPFEVSELFGDSGSDEDPLEALFPRSALACQ